MIPSRAQKGGSRASVNVPEAYHRELVVNWASNHLLALGCGSFCQNHVPEVVSRRSNNVSFGEMCPVSQRWLKSLVSYLKRWDTYGKTKAPCQADLRTRNCPASPVQTSFSSSPTALGDSFPSSVAARQPSLERKPCPCPRNILWTKSHKALVSCYPRL